jgi:hypothetical protein
LPPLTCLRKRGSSLRIADPCSAAAGQAAAVSHSLFGVLLRFQV